MALALDDEDDENETNLPNFLTSPTMKRTIMNIGLALDADMGDCSD
jgi:hypothetical protein